MTSRFYGAVGYSLGPTEVAPGVVEEALTERSYYGSIGRTGVNARVGENILPDLDITNQFSLVADAYALENFHNMRYLRWSGVNWTVKQVEVLRPRLIIRVGGVYNGPTYTAPEDAGTPDAPGTP